MSNDYNSGLPVRTEADGTDERLHAKLVDYDDPSLGMQIDSDKNAHVEMHGNDEANVDRVIATNEKGNIALDGDYDVANNTNPSSAGLIAHDRDATHDRTKLNQRVTATPGEGDTVNLDVSLHDENGQNYDANNPLPVTFEESEGDEKHEFTETEDVIKNTSTVHSYSVADGRTLILYRTLCSGSGKIKALLEIGDGAASEAFTTKAVTFNSTSSPQADIDFGRVGLKVVGTADTTTLRITLTNRDNQPQDIHSTFVGVEKNTVI